MRSMALIAMLVLLAGIAKADDQFFPPSNVSECGTDSLLLTWFGKGSSVSCMSGQSFLYRTLPCSEGQEVAYEGGKFICKTPAANVNYEVVTGVVHGTSLTLECSAGKVFSMIQANHSTGYSRGYACNDRGAAYCDTVLFDCIGQSACTTSRVTPAYIAVYGICAGSTPANAPRHINLL